MTYVILIIHAVEINSTIRVIILNTSEIMLIHKNLGSSINSVWESKHLVILNACVIWIPYFFLNLIYYPFLILHLPIKTIGLFSLP